jgi:hypothetical protein
MDFQNLHENELAALKCSRTKYYGVGFNHFSNYFRHGLFAQKQIYHLISFIEASWSYWLFKIQSKFC